MVSTSYELREPHTGNNLLYGTVRTRNGDVHRGFLRWDRNEGSWGGLLDVTSSMVVVRCGTVITTSGAATMSIPATGVVIFGDQEYVV